MASSRRVSRVQEIIVRAGLIDEMQVRSANAHLDKWGGAFSHVLVELGFVDEEKVVEAIGAGLRMQVMHLGTVPKDAAALGRLDASYCEEHLVFPISLRDRVLSLAMVDPTQIDVIDEVKMRYMSRVTPYLASGTEILSAISKHYRNVELAHENNRARNAVTTELGSRPSAPGQVTSRMQALKGSSATSMLNDILGDDVGELSPAEMARLQTAQQTQEKAGQILRALRALLDEKGALR